MMSGSYPILDLESPISSAKPSKLIDTPLDSKSSKRVSRKRSFSECRSSRSTPKPHAATPTKKRKSLEGYIIERQTPDQKGEKIYRHVRNRAEKQDGNVFELSGIDLRQFCTPPGRDPLRLFPDLSQDGEASTPTTPRMPFSQDSFCDILKRNRFEDTPKRQVMTPPPNRFQKDFPSLASSLNLKRSAFREKRNDINCQEVRQLIIDDEIGSTYVLLDCRFEYEYYGGHLRTAVKCTTREDVEKIFEKYEMQPSIKFILHCEHSACRAPRCAAYLACLYDMYVVGHQPEILIMTGGYSKFWKLFHNDDRQDKIFQRKGYVKQQSHHLQCRNTEKAISKGWNKVLLCDISSCEISSPII